MPKELNISSIEKAPKYLQQLRLSVFYKLDVGCCVAFLKNDLYLYLFHLRILSTLSDSLFVFYKLDFGRSVALLQNYLHLYLFHLRILSTIFKTKVGNGNRIVNN